MSKTKLCLHTHTASVISLIQLIQHCAVVRLGTSRGEVNHRKTITQKLDSGEGVHTGKQSDTCPTFHLLLLIMRLSITKTTTSRHCSITYAWYPFRVHKKNHGKQYHNKCKTCTALDGQPSLEAVSATL